SVDVTVACQASDELTLADAPGGSGEIALRQCRAVRLTDGAARVSGVLANGTGGVAKKVVANFRLGKLEAPYTFPGALKAGESRPFIFYVPSCLPFDSVAFDLSFDGAGAAAIEAEIPAPPSSRRTAMAHFEGGSAKLPPPSSKPPEEASAPP